MIQRQSSHNRQIQGRRGYSRQVSAPDRQGRDHTSSGVWWDALLGGLTRLIGFGFILAVISFMALGTVGLL
jgi:hypothetical protein